MRPSLASLALTAAILMGGCGADAPEPSAASGPSGAMGVMTAEAGAAAVAALCDLRSAPGLDVANATFFDRAHQTLHVLAAATETVDRVPSAALLEAKQRVEADLRSDTLPSGFRADVEALLDAVRAALEAVGLPNRGC